LEVDHVIAGTGYQVDLKRLPFPGDAVRSQIKLEGTWPALSRHFESSLPGLYFVGLAFALTFGPLARLAQALRHVGSAPICIGTARENSWNNSPACSHESLQSLFCRRLTIKGLP